MAAGAYLEARNKQHYTALCIAAQQGHADMLGFLLDRYTLATAVVPVNSASSWISFS